MSNISRNKFISMTSAAAAFTWVPTRALSIEKTEKYVNMYGLIGKITAKAGRRDDLVRILLKETADMPGCLSYIVSKDSENDDAIWVTEVWESKESHRASLSLPSVQETISQGRPLIEEFGEQIELEPVGGHGLVSTETQKRG